ncbi:MAG: HAD family phosphatase, partial [Candidatus Marinimicrobia bacterium]|nr:HAD family phosphatase [Candidatus Neomarinimicrobiota bacterium]
MIKAIIFDMDGVVIDSEPLYKQAQERLFGEFGVTIPEDDWKLFRGCTEDSFLQLVGERYSLSDKTDVLRERGRRYVQEVFDAGLDFMPGFKEFHATINGHFRTGLV